MTKREIQDLKDRIEELERENADLRKQKAYIMEGVNSYHKYTKYMQDHHLEPLTFSAFVEIYINLKEIGITGGEDQNVADISNFMGLD